MIRDDSSQGCTYMRLLTASSPTQGEASHRIIVCIQPALNEGELSPTSTGDGMIKPNAPDQIEASGNKLRNSVLLSLLILLLRLLALPQGASLWFVMDLKCLF